MNPSDRQADLFGGRGFAPDRAEPVVGDWAPVDATTLSDTALIEAFAGAGLRDSLALAEEAARRKLTAAVPALGAICRRFKGFGQYAAIPEQASALSALAQIGGREAAATIARVIAEEIVQGPGLPAAIAAAVAAGAGLPAETVLAGLRDPRPEVRADACRLARPSAGTTAVLVDLLTDLHDSVTAAAACALGRMGREEARPRLIRLLANDPSPEAIDAFAGIADDDGLVVLGRLAVSRPELAEAILDALEENDLPRAAQVAAGVRRRLG
jgi:HEAT repeat protein